MVVDTISDADANTVRRVDSKLSMKIDQSNNNTIQKDDDDDDNDDVAVAAAVGDAVGDERRI